jgi:hypothetical protein
MKCDIKYILIEYSKYNVVVVVVVVVVVIIVATNHTALLQVLLKQ